MQTMMSGFIISHLRAFPTAVNAQYNSFIAMATEQAQLIGGSVTCQAVKPNYDIASFNETFEPNGSVEPVLIAGTGLWSSPVSVLIGS